MAPGRFGLWLYPTACHLWFLVVTTRQTVRTLRKHEDRAAAETMRLSRVWDLTSGSGQSRQNWAVRVMSAFAPMATELRTSLIVRFVPSADATLWRCCGSGCPRRSMP